MALKLTIELVPKTSWYSNMRNKMRPSQWDKLRKNVYEEYENKCGICGSKKGRLNCHEIWKYDDTNHEQKLKGFIALCDMCHHVKHIGYAGILAVEGQLDFEKVIRHYMKVNNCNKETFEKHKKRAFSKWRKRSTYKWKVDLGEYASLVEMKRK